MREMSNPYCLVIGGLLHVDEDTRLLAEVEVYAGDTWVPLVTDISATEQESIKVIVDGENPSELIQLYFDSYEELEQIKAIRITGMAVGEGAKRILHIVRTTINITFEKSLRREYGITANIQFPMLLQRGETIQQMFKRDMKFFENQTAIFLMEYSSGKYAEFDDYCQEGKKKMLIPKGKAMEVLNTQFRNVEAVLEKEGTDRWNFFEKYCSCRLRPVVKEPGRELIRMELI